MPPPDSVAQLKGQGFNIIAGQYPHTILFFLNLAEPPFDNVKARQALEYAIDREKLCTSLLNGLCAPSYQYTYEGHPWFDPEFGKTYKYDPAKAKQLMAEAGLPNGFQFTIAYPTGGSGNMWPGPMMEFMQSNFKAVGMDMKMVPLEWNNILGISRAGFLTPENKKYNGMYFSVGYGAPYLADRFSSWRIPPKGCCNPTNYTTAPVDKAFTDAMSAFEPDAQNKALARGLGLMAADAPVLFVVHDLNLRVTAPSRTRLHSAEVLVSPTSATSGSRSSAMLLIVARRLAAAIPALVGVSIMIFVLLNVLPGDPLEGLLAPDSTPADRAGSRPRSSVWPTRCRSSTSTGSATCSSGDLGNSFSRRRPVSELIGNAFTNTLILAGCRGGHRPDVRRSASAPWRRCGRGWSRPPDLTPGDGRPERPELLAGDPADHHVLGHLKWLPAAGMAPPGAATARHAQAPRDAGPGHGRRDDRADRPDDPRQLHRHLRRRLRPDCSEPRGSATGRSWPTSPRTPRHRS